jgi:hypothetical protein
MAVDPKETLRDLEENLKLKGTIKMDIMIPEK